MKICIDPGHSGPFEPGACSGGYTEAALNMVIARKVGERLADIGHDVTFTREGDIDTDSLVFRAMVANTAQTDIFVSIHCNAAASPTARGVETYCFAGSQQGRELAVSIQTELAVIDYTTDRGVKTANFAVLRLTDMPAVLIECGFLTSEKDRLFLIDPCWQDKIAGAITTGVQIYFG